MPAVPRIATVPVVTRADPVGVPVIAALVTADAGTKCADDTGVTPDQRAAGARRSRRRRRQTRSRRHFQAARV